MLLKRVYPYEEYTERIKDYIATRDDWKFTRSVDIDDITQLCHEYLFEKFNRNILNRSNFNATIVKAINDHPEYLCRKETVTPFVLNLTELMDGIIDKRKLNNMSDGEITDYLYNSGLLNELEYMVLRSYAMSHSIQGTSQLNLVTSDHVIKILDNIIAKLYNKEEQ